MNYFAITFVVNAHSLCRSGFGLAFAQHQGASKNIHVWRSRSRRGRSFNPRPFIDADFRQPPVFRAAALSDLLIHATETYEAPIYPVADAIPFCNTPTVSALRIIA